MRHLKDALAEIKQRLVELEEAARKLPNQNFADLIKSARGRLAQALEHPDLEKVEQQLMGGEQLPFGDHSRSASEFGGETA